MWITVYFPVSFNVLEEEVEGLDEETARQFIIDRANYILKVEYNTFKSTTISPMITVNKDTFNSHSDEV